ncbi:MAG TPA: hypothetical protein VFD10_04045 [Atribacterota bacterium]|nr:hypothetical protein [Atribacterota bacterium]
MRCPEVIYQEVNKGRLTIILIKYRGREKETIYNHFCKTGLFQ